ncbi:MAG: AAA family ATPase [Candidatus Micrarchaeia archaeon]
MKRKKLIVAIMGTPGVGKTTFARKLSKKLGAELISANEVVNKYGLYSGLDKFNTKIVKMKELEKKINELVRGDGKFVVEGHLLSDIKIKNAIAIVLREHLNVLWKRLKERGYAKEKIMENITSEATDYSGIAAEKNYKRVYEFLSSDRRLMKKVLAAIEGKERSEDIELLEELLPFIKK